ncbi:MAG: hypothetical protein PW790_12690 [Parvibaculaceae bacterium]|nr:hypothetical protein [Parvibaculaceae bacterium]
MPDAIIEVLSLYGPLAMGWVCWFIVDSRAAKDAHEREARLLDTVQNNTIAMTTLAERVNVLTSRSC